MADNSQFPSEKFPQPAIFPAYDAIKGEIQEFVGYHLKSFVLPIASMEVNSPN